MRLLRRHLLDERGIPPEWTRITGYSKRDIANWDHHQPLDDCSVDAVWPPRGTAGARSTPPPDGRLMPAAAVMRL